MQYFIRHPISNHRALSSSIANLLNDARLKHKSGRLQSVAERLIGNLLTLR